MSATSAAWSRAEWVENTLPVWQTIVDPVAEHVAGAMGNALPAEAQQFAGPMAGMLRQLGGSVFGAQVGQALGELAGEVVSSSDIGLPLGPTGQAILLPDNVAKFAEGLGLTDEDVRLYLALREVAHQRLYAGVPWLRQHVLAAVADYAAGHRGRHRQDRARDGRHRPAEPGGDAGGARRAACSSPRTPSSRRPRWSAWRPRSRWSRAGSTTSSGEATKDRMPAAVQLAETVRRRRAAGGPAEQTFATLVGLQLRPRRLRDAANLWAAVRDARGVEGRDELWSHPDLLPSATDLDDPIGFAQHAGELADIDITDFLPDEDRLPGRVPRAEPGGQDDEGNRKGRPTIELARCCMAMPCHAGANWTRPTPNRRSSASTTCGTWRSMRTACGEAAGRNISRRALCSWTRPGRSSTADPAQDSQPLAPTRRPLRDRATPPWPARPSARRPRSQGYPDLTIEASPLQLSRHKILAGGCADAYHLDVQFLVTATAGTEYVVSEESHDLAWFPLDALPADPDGTVRALVKRVYRPVT